jgi:trk system potassium uptake protein TrkH
VVTTSLSSSNGEATVHPLVYYGASFPLIIAAASHVVAITLVILFGHSIHGVVAFVQAITALAYLSIAFLVLYTVRPSRPLSLHEALVLVAYSWIMVPILSAIPVSLGLGVPFIDSWFESVSGFTTTGLSVFTGGVNPDYGVYVPAVEELPPTVLWWRAVTQWIGGFGIVVVFLIAGRMAGLPPHLIGLAEGRFERLEPSIARSIRELMKLYTTLTIVATIILFFAGMSLEDAVYHALTALSTGGFSNHSESISYYKPLLVGVAAAAAMVMGASNFADLYTLVHRIKRGMSIEGKTFTVIWLLGLLGMTGILLGLGVKETLVDAVKTAYFDVTTALTTTGFGVEDFSVKPEAYKLLVIALMLIGGSAFSTAGGIKLYRVSVAAASLRWSIRRLVRGRYILTTYKLGKSHVDAEGLMQVVSIIFLFIITDLIGTILLSLMVPERSIVDAAFEATSALCTVGLSVGIIGATSPLMVKLLLIVLMTLGRLEVYTYIAALAAAVIIVKEKRRAGLERKRPERLRFKTPMISTAHSEEEIE